MNSETPRPWKRIKPKWTFLVKALLLAATMTFGASASPPPAMTPEYSSEVQFRDDLPRIKARNFRVRIVARSRSNLMYLLEDDSSERPRIGRIVLLRDGKSPVMAFRVLKTYPGKKRFAARKVRRYGDFRILKIGDSYEASEKLSNLDKSSRANARPPTLPSAPKQDADLDAPDAPPSSEGAPHLEPPKTAPVPQLEAPAAPTASPPELPPAAEPTEVAPSPAPEAPPAAPEPAPSPAPEAPAAETPTAPAADPTPTPSPAENPGSSSELDDLERELGSTDVKSPKPDAAPEVAQSPEPAPEATPDTAVAQNDPAPEPKAEEKPKKKPAPEEDPQDEDAERNLALSVDEVTPFDPDRHALSAEIGYFKNLSSGGGSAYFSGAGLRYGLTLGRMLLANSKSAQDSLTLEAGLFLYTVQNYSGSVADSYTVMPAIGALRYTVLFNENYGIFAYGGGIRNFVTSSSQGTATSIALLNSYGPAIGAGLLFRIGPKWEARVDLGSDMIGTGIVLRF